MNQIKNLLRPLLHKSRMLHELMLLAGERRGWRAFMRGLHWILTGLTRRKTIVDTRQGTYAISTRDSAIARHLFCDGEFELQSIRGLPELLLKAGFTRHSTIDTLFDVGANIGVISIGMVKLGIAQQAVAIEPEPHNVDLLEENIRLNGLGDRISCIHCGLSDKVGSLQLELSEVNHGDHRIRKMSTSRPLPEKCAESGRQLVEVECRTLDSVAAAIPRGPETREVVWIDVQGHEGFVFAGGLNYLKSGVPTVAEFWPYGMQRSGMSLASYLEIVTSIWSGFFDMSQGSFQRQPVGDLEPLFHDLSTKGAHTNLLFCR